MSVHTPGPWEVWDHTPGDGWHLVGPPEGRGAFVAELPHIEWGQPGRPFSEQEANARLISAAPELLETAKAILPYFDLMWPPEESGNRARQREAMRAAVAKAEGRK